jgi:hypothetical protein
VQEQTRYGDGSVRPIGETTKASRPDAAEKAEGEPPPRSSVSSLTFVAGLGGGQGYGVRGYGAASKRLVEEGEKRNGKGETPNAPRPRE